MPNDFFTMPAQFGSIVGDSSKQLATNDKLDVTIQLEVEIEVAQTLLPTWTGGDGKTYGYRALPMGPNGKPLLLVNYTQERDVEYMAGDGYNEIEFYLSTEFIGERDWLYQGESYNSVHGMFAVLLLPSDVIPLLAGRDIMGTPKHLADVKNMILGKMFPEDQAQSGWFEAHDKQGNAFIAGHMKNIVPAPYETLDEPPPETQALPSTSDWVPARRVEPGIKGLLWKYVSAADWVSDQPDLSYNIAIALSDVQTKELSQPMVGDGNLIFPNALDASKHSNISPAIDVIKNMVEQHSSPFPGNVLVRHYTNAYRAQDMHITDGPRLPLRDK